MFGEKLQNLIKTFKEQSHSDASKGEKSLLFAESGLKGDTLKWMMGLKYGKLTHTTLALDGAEDSDVLMNLRLLDSQETIAIEEQMLKLVNDKGFMPFSLAYNLSKTAKILSLANKSATSAKINDIELTEQEFLTAIPPEMLLAIGAKYSDFVRKHSPATDEFTQDIFNEIMNKLNECDGDLGKLRTTLAGLSFALTVEMVVELFLQTKDLTKRLDSCFTGV